MQWNVVYSDEKPAVTSSIINYRRAKIHALQHVLAFNSAGRPVLARRCTNSPSLTSSLLRQSPSLWSFPESKNQIKVDLAHLRKIICKSYYVDSLSTIFEIWLDILDVEGPMLFQYFLTASLLRAVGRDTHSFRLEIYSAKNSYNMGPWRWKPVSSFVITHF